MLWNIQEKIFTYAKRIETLSESDGSWTGSHELHEYIHLQVKIKFQRDSSLIDNGATMVRQWRNTKHIPKSQKSRKDFFRVS